MGVEFKFQKKENYYSTIFNTFLIGTSRLNLNIFYKNLFFNQYIYCNFLCEKMQLFNFVFSFIGT